VVVEWHGRVLCGVASSGGFVGREDPVATPRQGLWGREHRPEPSCLVPEPGPGHNGSSSRGGAGAGARQVYTQSPEPRAAKSEPRTAEHGAATGPPPSRLLVAITAWCNEAEARGGRTPPAPAMATHCLRWAHENTNHIKGHLLPGHAFSGSELRQAAYVPNWNQAAARESQARKQEDGLRPRHIPRPARR
jgi:hypothetical protein